jgi:hypothetical protein
MTLPASAGRLFIGVLILTTLFPVVASLLPVDQVPQWLGLLDVSVAAVFAVLGIWIESALGRAATESDRARAWWLIRGGSFVVLVLLAVFLIQPGVINWSVLIVGLAWRAWLLIWALPAVIASLRGAPHP